jgi:signal transduction histidine kinase
VAVALRDSGGSITLLVADEGSGISDDVKPHLFEPGHSSRAGGTGLGLAISQLLARQIGASLILVDTHSHGTTFRLTLPRQSQECIAGALDESASSALCRDGPVKS